MEVKLDKRYALEAALDAAWTVLRDVRAVTTCMPGAQITETLDDRHHKGTVRTKVGPAVMNFGGDVEVRAVDDASRTLELHAKGSDRAGSSAAMHLVARVEGGDAPGRSVLIGTATVTVSGKLAQFGSRLLVPVSDAILAQFADNFRAAAAAVPAAGTPSATADEPTTVMRMIHGAQQPGPAPGTTAAPAAPSVAAAASGAGDASAAPAAAPAASALPPSPPAPTAVRELNALALLWSAFKIWLAGLFGRPRT